MASGRTTLRSPFVPVANWLLCTNFSEASLAETNVENLSYIPQLGPEMNAARGFIRQTTL